MNETEKQSGYVISACMHIQISASRSISSLDFAERLPASARKIDTDLQFKLPETINKHYTVVYCTL